MNKQVTETKTKTTKAPVKVKAKAPVKRGATKRPVKRATKTPIATLKPKTPAKAAPKVKASGAKLKLVAPKKNWKIAFRDNSVNGAIVAAIHGGAHDLDALVAYFEEHSGMAPNKSLEYKQKPKTYIAGYITYLVKHNVVTRA